MFGRGGRHRVGAATPQARRLSRLTRSSSLLVFPQMACFCCYVAWGMRCSKIGGLNGPDTSPQSALRFGAAAAVGTLPTLRPPPPSFAAFISLKHSVRPL